MEIIKVIGECLVVLSAIVFLVEKVVFIFNLKKFNAEKNTVVGFNIKEVSKATIFGTVTYSKNESEHFTELQESFIAVVAENRELKKDLKHSTWRFKAQMIGLLIVFLVWGFLLYLPKKLSK